MNTNLTDKNDIFENEILNLSGFKIPINKLTEVGLLNFDFLNVKIEFVYLEVDTYFFMYSNTKAYSELLKVIAGNRKEVRQKLLQYQNNYGVEHALWKQLVCNTIFKFNLDMFKYADNYPENTGLDYSNDYFNYNCDDYHAVFPIEIKSTKETYDFYYSMLPKNLPFTKRKFLKQKAEASIKKFVDICGSNFENKELYLTQLETDNGNSIDKWIDSKKDLQSLMSEFQELGKEEIIETKCGNDFLRFLEYCINYVTNRIEKLNEKVLFQQYGPIDDMKKSLRESIDNLGFMELLDLFKEYRKKEDLLCSKARHTGMQVDEFPYNEYINIFKLGSVLISDKMNKLNRNKAKNKYIPQELLDEALIFYYDTSSVQEAYTVRSNEKYAQDKQGGDIGEQKVEYALRWLDKSYIQIQKKSKDKIGNKCIYIQNPEFINEKQEYDHLIVSSKGVFSIETKNFSGKLVIDQYGNWIRKKNNEEEGIKNPLQQIRQHEKVLMSFLPQDCNVISIICIANDKAIIEGIENCPIPIVKSDMLVEFIEKWNGNKMRITDSQVNQCVREIYNHMIQ